MVKRPIRTWNNALRSVVLINVFIIFSVGVESHDKRRGWVPTWTTASRKPFDLFHTFFLFKVSFDIFIDCRNLRNPKFHEKTQTHPPFGNWKYRSKKLYVKKWHTFILFFSCIVYFNFWLYEINDWWWARTLLLFVGWPDSKLIVHDAMLPWVASQAKNNFFSHSTHQRWICELFDWWWTVEYRMISSCERARATFARSSHPNKKVQVESSARNLVNQSHTMAKSINYATFHDFVDCYCLLCCLLGIFFPPFFSLRISRGFFFTIITESIAKSEIQICDDQLWSNCAWLKCMSDDWPKTFHLGAVWIHSARTRSSRWNEAWSRRSDENRKRL